MAFRAFERAPRSPYFGVLFGGACAAAADATFALRGVLASHAPASAAVGAFVVAWVVVAAPLGVALAGAVALARQLAMTPAARAAALEVTGGHGPLAAALAVGAGGVAATRAVIAGRAAVASMSPHIAATVIVSSTIVGLVGAGVVALIGARVAGPRLVALEQRAPRLRVVTRGLAAHAIVVAVAIVVLDAMLLREYVAAPAAGLLGWLIGSRRAIASTPHPPSALRAAVFVTALVVAALVAPRALARLPGRARIGVAQRPPYGSVLLAAVRKAVDRDRDGYSPILGGGDCDDADPSVHPGAYDVPGNGRDENCSGADAVAWTPPAPPAFVRPAALAAHPNVVVVVVDALRPDRLGFAGNPRPVSPAIDRFRRSATWFRRAYAPAPSTRYALASVFTGLDGLHVPHARGAGLDFALGPDVATLAEHLDGVGYDRVGVTIPYVVHHMRGIGRGFRVWSAPRVDGDDELGLHAAPRATDEALAHLAAAHGRPLFLFVHYACTHAPYLRHPEHDFGAGDEAAYDSALAHCDEQIGRLLAAIDARADGTAVVVMSDHGELLGEHGLDGHGTSLLEPAVRSLLLVRAPGFTAPTVDAPVTLADLHPTILMLAGAPAPPTAAWNLLAASAPDAPPRPIFLYVDDTRSGVRFEGRAVVDGRYKLVRDLGTGAEQLRDLAADPGETQNLRRVMPDVHARLDAMLDGAR